MDKKHELLCRVKELWSELGRLPKRDEVEQIGISRHTMNLTFGGWTPLLHALGAEGLDLAKQHKKQQVPAIQNKEVLQRAIEIYQRKEKRESHLKPIKGYEAKKIAVCGDVHFPFASADALSAFYLQLEIHKPDCVVQIGDLVDAYSQSKFPRSLNVITPQAEDELAFEQAREFWATVQKICGPNVQCFQVIGNHDSRSIKRVIESWPEGEHMIKEVMKQKFTFEGVTTIYDPTEELVINDIIFIHGHYSKLGAHRDYYSRNVVCGHSHRGGVDYRAYGEQVLWEANSGFVGDPYSKALSYRPSRIHNWTHGYLLIDEFGPRFIAF